MANYTTRAGFGKPVGGQVGWGTVFNRDLDQLDLTAAVGHLDVRPAAPDPDTGRPTDLKIQLRGGFVDSQFGRIFDHLGWSITPPDTITDIVLASFALPPSSVSLVFLGGFATEGAAAGDFGSGTDPRVRSTPASSAGPPAFPARSIPMAIVYTDATKVTAIVDARRPARVVGAAYPLRLRTARIPYVASHPEQATTPSDTATLADATGGPFTIDLWPIREMVEEAVLVVKADASANAVTVRPWPGGTLSEDDTEIVPADTGPTVVLTGQYQAAFLIADTFSTPATWVRLKFV